MTAIGNEYPRGPGNGASQRGSDRPWSCPRRLGLQAKVAVGVALPVFIMLILLSLVRNMYQRDILEEQLRLTTVQMGEAMLGSLRYAMLTNDGVMLSQTVANMATMATVRRVSLVGADGRVAADSSREGNALTERHLTGDPGCIECHQFAPADRPRSTRDPMAGDVLRIATPIRNETECSVCHTRRHIGDYLGVLIIDVSDADVKALESNSLRIDLTMSMISAMFVTLGVYWLILRLVVRRVRLYRRALHGFAAGDFDPRLPASGVPEDELDDLAGALNHMAHEVRRQAHERARLDRLHQQAIAEERARLARELHDGLSQLLGYVNTKTMAVRTMVHNRDLETADRHLLQLEQAARQLFTSVREAIVAMRGADNDNAQLTCRLRVLITRFSSMSDLPVVLTSTQDASELSLPGQCALQLLRIAEEALTNVSRHASANHAWIHLGVADGVLEMTIADDGQGIVPDVASDVRRLGFGLAILRERAAAVGAGIRLDSRVDGGTCVTVRLPLDDSSASRTKEG